MSRHAMRCALVSLTLSVAVGFAVKACSSPELVETFGEKEEWSTLQAIEAQARAEPIDAPVVRRVFDQDVIGVRGAAGKTIWILAKTASPPFYKQLPEGQYDLPRAFVERLEREHRLSYTVGVVLRSHARE